MSAASPKRLGFSRSQRLKQGRDFARARQEGQRTVQGCLIANWRRLPTGAATRLGVVTSRKIGGAVVRNQTFVRFGGEGSEGGGCDQRKYAFSDQAGFPGQFRVACAPR